MVILSSCGGGGGGSGSAPTPQAPTVNPTIPNSSYSFYTTKNQQITTSIGSSDIVLVSVSSQGTNGTASISSNKVVYIPNSNFVGSDTIIFNATRPSGNLTVTVNIVVSAVNTAPVANNLEIFVQKGNGVYFTLPVTNEDGDTLTYEMLTLPSYGVLALRPESSPNWAYDAPNAELQTTFSYRVFDGQLYSNVATVTINVTRPNQAPSFPVNFLSTVTNLGKAEINEDATLVESFIAIDPDDSVISGSVLVGSTKGTVTLINNGGKNFTLTYTPNANYFGNDSFTLRLNDSLGGKIDRVVNVKVLPVNDAPEVATTLASVTLEKNEIIGKLLDFGISDIDSTALLILYDTTPTLVDINYISSSKKIIVTPKVNKEGTEVVTIRISDGFLTSELITINVLVKGEPLPSVQPINQELAFDQGTSKTFTLLGTNIGDRIVNYQILSYPNGGASTITGTLPNLTYTPPSNFHGSTTLSFLIYNEDDEVASSTGFITFNVARTDFSNTWSIDLSGTIYENELLMQDANYVMKNRFFISGRDFSPVFSIFTDNMQCGIFGDEYVWLNLTSDRKVMPFDRTENWVCFDQYYLMSAEPIVKTISPEEVLETLTKDNIFANYFDYNSIHHFDKIKLIPECSLFETTQELVFILGDETEEQKECYLALAESLIDTTSLRNYYQINNTISITEGIYTPVKKLLNYILSKEANTAFLDKQGFLEDVSRQVSYYTMGAYGLMYHFESCKQFYTSNGEEFIELATLLDYPRTSTQESCILDLFKFYDSNFEEFYTRTGFIEPTNKISYNINIEHIMNDILTTILDPEFQASVPLGYCSAENYSINSYMFDARADRVNSIDTMIQLIPSCSTSYLSTVAGYNAQATSIYSVLRKVSPTSPIEQAIEACHLDILATYSDKISYSIVGFKKASSSSYQDIINKTKIALILDTAQKHMDETCTSIPQEETATEYIYESNNYAIYKKEISSKVELFFGYKKSATDFSSDYNGFLGESVKRTSLISSTLSSFNQKILYENELVKLSSNADFILLPYRTENGKQVYTKITLEQNEIVLTGIYTKNMSNEMELSGIDEYIGKGFIMVDGSSKTLIFSTYDIKGGYYLYEVKN